jgi:hypothetical protein
MKRIIAKSKYMLLAHVTSIKLANEIEFTYPVIEDFVYLKYKKAAL